MSPFRVLTSDKHLSVVGHDGCQMSRPHTNLESGGYPTVRLAYDKSQKANSPAQCLSPPDVAPPTPVPQLLEDHQPP